MDDLLREMVVANDFLIDMWDEHQKSVKTLKMGPKG